MSRMIALYNEIFKILPLIDAKFDDIISRKDASIPFGKYLIRSELCNFDGQYWKITISYSSPYAFSSRDSLSFYKRSPDANMLSTSKYDSLVLTTLSDAVQVSSRDISDFSDYDYLISIPYDRSASVDERKMSVDLMYDKAGEREILYRVIDFQAMGLKNINVVSYCFDNIVDLTDGEVYNSLISRPFFRSLK